ncbi:MAG: GH3 auxin-responsive promoter family protein [Bacteroidales bacterium]
MTLINSLVTWFNTSRMYQIDILRKHPENVQRETLFKLLNTAKNTEFGRRYDFKSISSENEFRRRLPLQSYDDIKPFVDKLREGYEDILWPGEIKWFAKSSGTTSDKSKFIPVSHEALEYCHFRGAKDILAIYTSNNPDTHIFSGKALTIGGSHQVNNFNNQSFYGDLSAILLENTPFWVNFIRTPNTKIALMEKWEEKLEKAYEDTLYENVTNIAGVPSWNLVFLKYILEKTGKSNLLEIWPNLELFIHGGINFAPYREQFKKLIPSQSMNYLETYNASEGFFAIQDDPSRDDMLLMLDYGIYYEFIPMDQLDSDSPKTLSIGEVEICKNYAIVISTNGGLWRYVIGDTVMFTSLYPHKIKISGRTKHFINAFGEELIIDNAENALNVACAKTGAMISEYTAGPVFMGDNIKGAHEWLIEFEEEPENMEYFVTMLDNALQSLNSDYEAKRYKNITLDPPVVHSVKRNLFYEWLKEKGKLGGQNKVPRLANDRRYLDELLEINRRLSQ